MWALIRERLEQGFRAHAGVAGRLGALEDDARAGRVTPTKAADALLAEFGVEAAD